MSSWPSVAAQSNAVLPVISTLPASAPAAKSKPTASLCPKMHASISAFRPALFCASTWAPAAKSSQAAYTKWSIKSGQKPSTTEGTFRMSSSRRFVGQLCASGSATTVSRPRSSTNLCLPLRKGTASLTKFNTDRIGLK